MADSAELTARDVFEQIDRRLTRLEDDLRDFRQYVEQRFQFIEQRFISLEAKLDARFATIDARFATIDARFAALDAKIDRHFRWQLSISLMMWLSVMSAILLK
ncbi:MAG: hypothetical protein CME04_15215 [Gemmatimonadaceae bacterium]|jgi:hypothetical protein|nr:hypothetical protein [Gemmatimonadaceae bacterium]|tara:strand:+ start:261 stop:569 length:309 start_codon:yes stop_codon:yes gene_type:complete